MNEWMNEQTILSWGPSLFFLKVYFIDYAITVFPIFPLYPLSALHPQLSSIPPLSSCLWVVLISYLNSLFPTLVLTSPHLFDADQLCFLFPVPFPPIPSLPLPAENPPCDVHFSDSIPVIVVCLVFVFVFYI